MRYVEYSGCVSRYAIFDVDDFNGELCGEREKKMSEDAEYKEMRVSRFDLVEPDNSYWCVVRDVQTGVLYAVSTGYYNKGCFTVLVDADGKPLRSEISE